MAYQKRGSAALNKAKARLRGMLTGQSEMSLGDGLNLQGYVALIDELDRKLESHNLALAEADRTRIEFAEAEASLTAVSSRMLSAVAALYGKDSKEYEMAGGTPPSKRSRKRATTMGLNASQSTTGSSTTTFNGNGVNGSGTNGSSSMAQSN